MRSIDVFNLGKAVWNNFSSILYFGSEIIFVASIHIAMAARLPEIELRLCDVISTKPVFLGFSIIDACAKVAHGSQVFLLKIYFRPSLGFANLRGHTDWFGMDIYFRSFFANNHINIKGLYYISLPILGNTIILILKKQYWPLKFVQTGETYIFSLI